MKITEAKLRKVIRTLLEKRFDQLDGYGKGKGINIYNDLFDDEGDELKDDAFKIIDRSYEYLGGNVDIRTKEDLANSTQNDYTNFIAWDIDDDPEIDVIRGMKPKSGGMKLALSATDGSVKAAEHSKKDTDSRLRKGGHWAEMSSKSAVVGMRTNLPVILDKDKALKMINKPGVVWHGEHPYFSDKEKYAENKIEAERSKTYAEKFGVSFDGWYERKLGGSMHVKMIFGKI